MAESECEESREDEVSDAFEDSIKYGRKNRKERKSTGDVGNKSRNRK